VPKGVRHNNLKNIDVDIPLGTFTVVSGVSGSGKSSLINDVLYAELGRILHRTKGTPGVHDAIVGLERVNKVIRVTQNPLGQTPTSNAATYTGVFNLIRELFAQLPESKLRGYSARRFSFNVSGGRCEKCEGNGQLKIEMHFLPDVWVECDACKGSRYDAETLAVKFHGHSIADVLNLSCGEAARLFANIPKIRKVLKTLCDVGLDYLTLGQSAPTLSGGEAQRVKLAAELSRPDTGKTLYLLDEPTTGLHFEDISKLLEVLHRLVDLGNTVVVIEHNLDLIKAADWVIELGPEAGDEGGYMVAAGTPEDLATHAKGWLAASIKRRGSLLRTYTGESLIPVLEAGPFEERPVYDFEAEKTEQEGDLEITSVGETVRMPWEVDGPKWHTQDRTSRSGETCRWDGRILAEVVDRIESSECLGAADWSGRTVVEVRGQKKSHGWFFHAITAEQWLLKIKFRTAKRTFQTDELVERLDLKPLNDMPDLPLYGSQNRTKVKTLRGPFQEVELRVHSFDEIDHPGFWQFLNEAIGGFEKHLNRAETKPSEMMPWRVMGEKWHLSRKGFPLGKPAAWDESLLKKVCDLLQKTAPDGTFQWNNKVSVNFRLPDVSYPWATLHTKRPDALALLINGPKGKIALGKALGLGFEQDMTPKIGCDQLRLQFRAIDDLDVRKLGRFLKEHLAGVIGD
jgi:excinuclease ABC subunit A